MFHDKYATPFRLHQARKIRRDRTHNEVCA
jgi:hypothetical protein